MDPRFFRQYADLITEAETAPVELEEGWKDALAGAALAGSLALGGAGPAQAAPVQQPVAHTQQAQQQDQGVQAAAQIINKTFGTNISDAKTLDNMLDKVGKMLNNTRPKKAPGLEMDSDEFQNSPEGQAWAQKHNAYQKAVSLRHGITATDIPYAGISYK